MRTWWQRLLASPRALAVVGAAVAVVVAVAVTVVVTGRDAAPAASSGPGAGTSGSSTAGPGAGASDDPSADGKGTVGDLPPDRDAYCPAFGRIRSGGLSTQGEDGEGVDLAELGRTFDGLIDRYTAAARVSPRSLRDDYAQALDYLEQGRRATRSKDIGLLRALVVNLDSLNASMQSIQTKSAQFCP